MPKPTLVINPITGEQSFTKHPERLIQRRIAKQGANHLIITEPEKENPTYWNGSDNPRCLHKPGEVRS